MKILKKFTVLMLVALISAACSEKTVEPELGIDELDALVSDGEASEAQVRKFVNLIIEGLDDIKPDASEVAVQRTFADGKFNAEPFSVSYTVSPGEMAARLAMCASYVDISVKCDGKSGSFKPSEIKDSGRKISFEVSPEDLGDAVIQEGKTATLLFCVSTPESSYESLPFSVVPSSVEVIDGTLISPTSNVYGQIKDASTGKGIAGVPVSDGYSFVVTDDAGVYQMQADPRCRKVYYTTPANYKVALNSTTHLPAFFSDGTPDLKKANRYDFTLEPLPAVEEKFTLVMVGDPQCKSNAHSKRYVSETIPDIVSTLNANQKAGRYGNSYAFTLGDITFDSGTMWIEMRNSMSNIQLESGYLPFFQCIGNHDHNSLVKTNDYGATQKFTDVFGPTDYSVNRGKAHIIVMDDIMVTSLKDNSSPNKASWNYDGGFTSDQVKWLKDDLSHVADKENMLVFLCMHIPFREGSTSGGHNINTNKYYSEVLALLTQFKEAHVMIGHTHYPHNYIHKSYVCKGGLPIYEHVHGAACGAWWTCNSNSDGAPNGYSLYEIDGTHVRDWVAKGTNLDPKKQLRVFDGNQTYTGTKGYTYNWYTPSYTANGVAARGNAVLKDCLVAEVWNDDDTNWTVEVFKDGKKVGNMTRLPDNTCCNIASTAFFFNELNKDTSSYATAYDSHYWYFKPGVAPSEYSGWEVVATQKIPGSPDVTNVYSCNKLTVDYSEF